MLPQHANDLLFGKSASPHRSSPSDELTYQWHDFRGAGQALPYFKPRDPEALPFLENLLALPNYSDIAGYIEADDGE
jgi:hypothetical protein